MHDAKTSVKVANSLLPIAAKNTADGTGLGVAVAGFESVLMVLTMGVPLTTLTGSVYWTVQFQECLTDTAGSYTDIAAADLKGGVNDILVNADGEASRSISRSYTGSLPWVRILCTGVGTNTNGTPMHGVVILGLPAHAPQANDGAQL
jgi:hypothetical protein